MRKSILFPGEFSIVAKGILESVLGGGRFRALLSATAIVSATESFLLIFWF